MRFIMQYKSISRFVLLEMLVQSEKHIIEKIRVVVYFFVLVYNT